MGHIVIKKGKTIIHGQDADQIYDAATESKISIQQTDEVRTGEDSQLKMYLQNKKEVVQMYSESFVRINDSNDDETLISFMFGKARFIIERTMSKLRKSRRRFSIRTVNAVIGVKGTDFVVMTNGDVTEVYTLEGVVTMSNTQNLNNFVEIKKNHTARIEKSSFPSTPTLVSPETVQEIIEEDSIKEWSDLNNQEDEIPSKIPNEKSKKDKKFQSEETKNEQENNKETEKGLKGFSGEEKTEQNDDNSSIPVDNNSLERTWEVLEETQNQVEETQQSVDQLQDISDAAEKPAQIKVQNH